MFQNPTQSFRLMSRLWSWLFTSKSFARILDLPKSDGDFELWAKSGWQQETAANAEHYIKSNEYKQFAESQATYDSWIEKQLTPAADKVASLQLEATAHELNNVIPPKLEKFALEGHRLQPHRDFDPIFGLYVVTLSAKELGKPLVIRGCKIGQLQIKQVSRLELTDCQIGLLHLKGPQTDIAMDRCRIGEFRADSGAVNRLSMQNSRVHFLNLTPLAMPGVNPSILGNVAVDECSFPVRISSIFPDRAKGYTDMRAYLERLDHAIGTHQFRGIEGAAQLHEERNLFKWVIRLHRLFSNYSLSPLRAVWIVLGVWFGLSLVTFFTEGAKPSPAQATFFKYCTSRPVPLATEERAKVTWEVALCKEHFWSQVKRSELLPAQHLLNPLGLLQRPELLEPRTLWLRVLLMAQDVVNVLAYFYFFFAIRRRFRM